MTARQPSKRETRTPKSPTPAIPDLGKLHAPRKENVRAAKTIEAGNVLWDQRHIEKKLRRQRIARQEQAESNRGSHKLTSAQKGWLANHLPHWEWDKRANALTPRGHVETSILLDELITATTLPYVKRAQLRVTGVDEVALRWARTHMPKTLQLTLVAIDDSLLHIRP